MFWGKGNAVAGLLVLAIAVLALYLRTLTPDQRVQFFRKILADARTFIRTSRQQMGKVPPECETFAQELRARTQVAVVTPAIVVLNLAMFLAMCVGDGALSDSATLVAWGGNIGPRTTNGEWWRLVTSLFVHAGAFPLVANVLGVLSVGLMLERLVGSVAFTVTYLVAGAIAGIAALSAHAVIVNTGASGAVFGVYGLLAASVAWGFYRRSATTIPIAALKRLLPAAFFFLIVDLLTNGVHSEVRMVGFGAGLTAGLILAAGFTYRKPAPRRVFATVTATAGIVMVLIAPLRGLNDVRADVANVIAFEDRTAHEYDAVLERFSQGRSTIGERIELIDQIRPELQALRTRLESFHKVPHEHQLLVSGAIEYLKTRDESWRLRREALRKSNLQILSQADSVERASLDTFRKLKTAAASVES